MLLNKSNLKDCLKQEFKLVEFEGFEVKIIRLGLVDYLSLSREENSDDIVKNLLLLCCVDDNNERLFTEEDLNTLSPDIALKLFNECDELNKLRNNDLEERAKNS